MPTLSLHQPVPGVISVFMVAGSVALAIVPGVVFDQASRLVVIFARKFVVRKIDLCEPICSAHDVRRVGRDSLPGVARLGIS